MVTTFHSIRALPHIIKILRRHFDLWPRSPMPTTGVNRSDYIIVWIDSLVIYGNGKTYMVSLHVWSGICLNTLGLSQSGRRFEGGIFKCFFHNWIYPYIDCDFIAIYHKGPKNRVLNRRIYASFVPDVSILNIVLVLPMNLLSRYEVLNIGVYRELAIEFGL